MIFFNIINSSDLENYDSMQEIVCQNNFQPAAAFLTAFQFPKLSFRREEHELADGSSPTLSNTLSSVESDSAKGFAAGASAAIFSSSCIFVSFVALRYTQRREQFDKTHCPEHIEGRVERLRGEFVFVAIVGRFFFAIEFYENSQAIYALTARASSCAFCR